MMRWNDGNYWALKTSTEKSHRALARFMKKWKVCYMYLYIHCVSILCSACMYVGFFFVFFYNRMTQL